MGACLLNCVRVCGSVFVCSTETEREKESKNMDGVDLFLTLSQKQSVAHSGETLMYDPETAVYLSATCWIADLTNGVETKAHCITQLFYGGRGLCVYLFRTLPFHPCRVIALISTVWSSLTKQDMVICTKGCLVDVIGFTVSHRSEYTPHIFVNILLYIFMTTLKKWHFASM